MSSFEIVAGKTSKHSFYVDLRTCVRQSKKPQKNKVLSPIMKPNKVKIYKNNNRYDNIQTEENDFNL